MRLLVGCLVICAVTLGVLSVVWPAPTGMVEESHAALREQAAEMRATVTGLGRRVDNIEDRLFQVFLAAGGGLCASLATVVFQVLTHRQIRNGNGKNGGG